MQHLSWRRALTALLASTCAVGFSASTALAGGPSGPCSPNFIDAAGEEWDVYGDTGAISDGTHDTYDTYGEVYVGDTVSDDWAFFESSEDCTTEENGRELVTGADQLQFTNADDETVLVDAQRKFFVPESGQAFARWLDIFRNTSDTPVTFEYKFYGNYGEIGNNNQGRRVDSADGDDAISIGEAWGAFRHDYRGTTVASLWDGLGDDGWDALYGGEDLPGVDGNDDVEYVYDAITLQPGESAVFMHVEHQVSPAYSDVVGDDEAELASLASAADFARRNADGPPELFVGVSDDELLAVRNWNPDADRDGIVAPDNCQAVANPGQANLDRDGLGDACDNDIDGDGLTNAQEQNMGTNAASANSDGDALSDGVDRCPTLAGNDAEGCPPPAVITQQQSGSQTLKRLTPRGLTSKVVRTRGASTLTLRTSGRLRLPKGTGRKLCVKSTVAVQVKSGNRTVSMRRVPLRPDCTYRSSVTFKALSRLTGRLTVTAQFMGNGRLLRQSASPRTVAGA